MMLSFVVEADSLQVLLSVNMATKTIYGCVESDGSITFPDDACGYAGCIESDGRVSVTISTENCDDTYYGCVNTGTGAFQIIIPDDCCEYSEADCEGCCTDWQPDWVDVTVSGMVDCNGCYGGNCEPPAAAYKRDLDSVGPINTTHRLNKIGNCEYQADFYTISGTRTGHVAPYPCAGGIVQTYTVDFLRVNVDFCRLGNLELVMHIHFTDSSTDAIFTAAYSYVGDEECGEMSGSWTNEINDCQLECEWRTSIRLATGGSAIITLPEQS